MTALQEKTIPDSILQEFRRVVGPKNVLWEPVDLALYSYDAALDRAWPSAIVFPSTTQEVSEAVKICRKHHLPFVARGAGTNLCGGTIPLQGAVVIAPTKMKRLLRIDAPKRIAVVEPGMPNLFLKKELEPYGLHYAPDPASQKACTIGGNIGTNAGGPHCLKYGVTSQHVLGLEVVLPDGEIAELSLDQPGPDLTGLFVGSEGTLGIVTRATLNLLPIPQVVETMLVSFPSLEDAIQSVTDIISAGIIPATLEAMDKLTVQAVEGFIHAGYPTEAEAVLLIEVDGSSDLKGDVEQIRQVCARNHSQEFRLAANEAERLKLWEGRRGAYPAMARLAPNVLVEDGAVPRNKLPEALRKIRAIAKESGIYVSLLFHAGDGNLHPQILFDERDEEQTKKVKAAGYAMLKTCVELGGSISGEHGIGVDKREAMRWLFTPDTLRFFRKIKNAFDPENLANPEKLIPLAQDDPQAAQQPLAATEIPSSRIFAPANELECAAALRGIAQAKAKAFIQGGGSRKKPGDAAACILQTSNLNKVVEHDVENFTVTVQAGMEVAALQDWLRARRQKVILLGGGTVGGAISCNAPQSPRVREQILGMSVITADGAIAALGGKVMKNVAGYDAGKIFIGAEGSLGLILSVTLRTFPLHYALEAKAADRVAAAGSSPAALKIRQVLKRSLDPQNVFPAL